MYDSVFSALMTLMGLTFAAVGLILQSHDRHWVRHAGVWQSIRKHSSLAGILIAVTSFVSLVNVKSRAPGPFTPVWWTVLGLFVVSLGALAWLIYGTMRALRPTTVIKRIQQEHLQKKLGSDSVKNVAQGYLEIIKQLLSASLDVNDVSSFADTLHAAVTVVARPDSTLVDREGADHIESNRSVAREALRELRAQIEQALNDRDTSRPVVSACLVSFASIVEQWQTVDPSRLKDPAAPEHAQEAKVGLLDFGAEQLGYVCEGLLSVTRPSLSLTKQAADILALLVPEVDESVVKETRARLLTGISRAVDAGYEEEANAVLEAIVPWVSQSWADASPLVEMVASGRSTSSVLQSGVAAVVASLRQRIGSLDTQQSEDLVIELAHVFSMRQQRQTSTFWAELTSIRSVVVQNTCDSEDIGSVLRRLRGLDDTVLLENLRVYLSHAELGVDSPGKRMTKERQRYLQHFVDFFVDRLQSNQSDVSTSVDSLCQWLYPVLRDLARRNPSKLANLRGYVVTAARRLDENANVNPVFLSLISARATAEKAMMDLNLPKRIRRTALVVNCPQYVPLSTPNHEDRPVNRLVEGTLSRVDAASLKSLDYPGFIPPSRVPYDARLASIVVTVRKLLDLRPASGDGTGASAELLRSLLGSISYVFVGLEQEKIETQVEVLTNEQLLIACETLLSVFPGDLGDVSYYLTLIRDGARVSSGLEWPAEFRAKTVKARWSVVSMLCSAALGHMGYGLVEANGSVPPPPDETADAVEEVESSKSDPVTHRIRIAVDKSVRSLAWSISEARPLHKAVHAVSMAIVSGYDPAANNPEGTLLDVIGDLSDDGVNIPGSVVVDLILDLARSRVPEWATRTRKKIDDAVSPDEAFGLLRVLRSCLSTSEDGVEFKANGIIYCYRTEGTGRKDSIKWITNGLKSLARDWVMHSRSKDRRIIMRDISGKARSSMERFCSGEDSAVLEACFGDVKKWVRWAQEKEVASVSDAKVSRSDGGSRSRGQGNPRGPQVQ